jgi:dTDP-4-amino-4,6-dideoxygalactose transaminase
VDTRYNPHPRRLVVPLCQPPALGTVAVAGRLGALAELRAELGRCLGRASERVVLTSSGRAALCLGLRALRLRDGGARDEVVVPGFGCPQLVEAVIDAGLAPVLCDAGPDCSSPDLAAFTASCTPRTLAIVAAPVLGATIDHAGLERWASLHGVAVVDDAAQAFCGTLDASFGARGALGVLSFGRHKPICAGAGAALVINDPELSDAVARMAVELEQTWRERGAPPAAPRPWFSDVGTALEHPPAAPVRLHMTEEEARVVLARLAVANTEVVAANRLANQLAGRLCPHGSVRPRPHDAGLPRLFFAMEVDPSRRHALATRLADAGVETSWLYYPLHRTRRYAPHARTPLVHADSLWPRILLLPCRGWLSANERDVLLGALDTLEVAS